MESLGLVFRALVMLACLAVVPLVALYGKFLPDIVQAVVEAVKTRGHSNAIADPNTAGGEAPRFAGSWTPDGSAAPPPGPWVAPRAGASPVRA